MFTEEQYIKTNTNACINNCICFYLWRHQPFSETLKAIEEHENRYYRSEKMTAAIKAELQKMTTAEGVKAFINEYKKTYVCFCNKSVNTFIKGVYDMPGLTAAGIANIIQAQLSIL